MCSTEMLRDQLDGLLIREVDPKNRMEDSFPDNISRRASLEKSVSPVSSPSSPSSPSLALQRRQAKRKMERRGRFRTQPITFAEIKEVDEDKVELESKNSSLSCQLYKDHRDRKARSAHDLRRSSFNGDQRRRSSVVINNNNDDNNNNNNNLVVDISEDDKEEAADELGSLYIGPHSGKESLLLDGSKSFGLLSRLGRNTLL